MNSTVGINLTSKILAADRPPNYERVREYNLPELSQHSSTNRIIAKQTAKKTIKVFNRVNFLLLISK